MTTETESKYTPGMLNHSAPIDKIEPTITVSAPVISIEDYMHMSDSVLKEEKLIKAFDLKLNKIESEGKLSEYEETLKKMKSAKQIKINAYKMIALGSGVTKEKWDKTIKPYLLRTNFSFSDSNEFQYTEMVNDPKNKGHLKEITKVKLTNNLVDQLENKLPIVTIQYILNNYTLDEKTKADFKECMETMSDKSADEVLSSHVIKANSEMFGEASNANKNRMEETKRHLDNFQKTLEMSVSFISWKLKRIAIRENIKIQNDLDREFIKMEDKIAGKLQKDKKFKSLSDIVAKTWSL